MITREQIIAAASDAGLQLIWDGKLGREDYHSIVGSFPSLERFYAIAFAAGQESLRQQLAGANARIELIGETALNQQKREVMLREALEYHQAQTRPIQRTEEALAATDDLDGLILCHAEPCRDDGRCQYAIDHGAEGLGHCPEGKCCIPLYRAKELSK